MQYDASGNLVLTIRDNESFEKLEYNQNNLLVKKSNSDGDEWVYTYGPEKNLETTYYNGELSQLNTYDENYNVISKDFFYRSQDLRITYEYDAQGRLIKKQDWSSIENYTYL